MPYESPLRQRDGPLARCTAVLRRVSRGSQRAAGVRMYAHANMPPRTLSPEVTQHTRLRRVRAAKRWSESTHAPWKHTTPARRPSPSVHGRALTCQRRLPTSSFLAHVHARERATASSLSGGDVARVSRVRSAPRWLESARTPWKPTTPSRRPSPSVHGRVPTCEPQPPTSSYLAHVRTRENATVCSLSGGDAARALAARARRAAPVGVGPCPMEVHYASRTTLFLGARPRSDVPATASNH